MGSGVSLPPLTNASDLPPDDAIKYAKRYQIKPNELRYIFRRFHVLCKTNGRTLVPGDVPRTASLLKHDLSKRVISLMARSSKGYFSDVGYRERNGNNSSISRSDTRPLRDAISCSCGMTLTTRSFSSALRPQAATGGAREHVCKIFHFTWDGGIQRSGV